MGLRDIFTNPERFKFYGGAGYPTPNGSGGVNGVEPLLSLKYGKDSLGGGASRQPFIVTPIPGASATFNTNGLVIARSATDVERLSKFFTTTPGLLFIAKQNVLSQTNVRTQASNISTPQIQPNNGPYLPTNTLAQVGVSAAGFHFNKQGLLPNGDFSPQYNSNEVIIGVTDESTNRLINLTKDKVNYKNNQINILTYRGGPGSFLGVGSTNILFASSGKFRTGINNPLYTDNLNRFYGLLVPNSIVANPIQELYQQETYQSQPVTQLVDFRNRLRNNTFSSILSKSPNYGGSPEDGPDASIEQRVNLGNPGTRGNIISYTKGKILSTSNTSQPLDKINAKPLYRSQFVDPEGTTDLVKFRIEVIDNKEPAFGTFIHFRAFIDSFSDNYSADWSPTQYIGRGEQFYTYDKFTRTINMSWTVAAQSKNELIPMYQKLNYLASSLAPTYNDNGYMAGTLVRLTVGGYLYSQPGFITSLTYDIPSESPWEIGINDTNAGSDNTVKELPHIIKVSGFNFTPIHNFVPRKQTNTYAGTNILAGRDNNGNQLRGNQVSTFGPERFIALNTGDHNNYDTDNYI